MSQRHNNNDRPEWTRGESFAARVTLLIGMGAAILGIGMIENGAVGASQELRSPTGISCQGSGEQTACHVVRNDAQLEASGWLAFAGTIVLAAGITGAFQSNKLDDWTLKREAKNFASEAESPASSSELIEFGERLSDDTSTEDISATLTPLDMAILDGSGGGIETLIDILPPAPRGIIN